MDTALYFPYIRVPQTPWFTQVLLYWNQAATIVPESVLRRDGAVNPYMAELARERLLRYVHPDAALWQRSEDFDRTFLDFLDRRASPAPAPRDAVFERLHSSKLSWALFDQLRMRNLAREVGGPEWETWWYVERRTADAYMAYLASAISGAQAGMYPVSDRSEAIATLAAGTGAFDQRLADLRYALITRALPAPHGSVDAVSLRAFKDEHHDQLLRCRTHLNTRLADLAVLDDPQLREIKAAAAMQEISDDVASLRESMTRKRWPKVSIVGFGGVVGAALAPAAAVAAGGSLLAIGLAVGAGVLQLGSAAHAAAELMRMPRYNVRAPLAYAALAAEL